MKELNPFHLARYAKTWFIFAALTLTGCGCGNDVVRIVKQPDGHLQAVIFIRDCGATTGYSTQISILGSETAEPSGGGNVFIADDDHGKVNLSSHNELAVNVIWVTRKKLLIRYPQDARIFKRNATFRDIQIEYKREKSPDKP